MTRGAHISEDGKYRFSLWRIWDGTLPTVMFIMLNPSTANGYEDDPTIRRCIGYAKAWGYGGLYVCNLFAFRATKPKALKENIKLSTLRVDAIGYGNDEIIISTSTCCDKVIFAWGRHGVIRNRDKEVIDLFKEAFYLELTKDNIPKHPLFLKQTLIPLPFYNHGNQN